MTVRRAVVVGVNRYESEDFQPLRHAIDDAVRMKGFLDQLRRAGAFERVRLLTDPSDHQLQAELRTAARGLGTGDLLLFYFAGHGVQQNGSKQHLLLCPQARKDILQYGTNGALPHLFLDHLARQGKHDSLFIFDACRSDLLVQRRDGAAACMRGSDVLRTIGEDPEPDGPSASSCVKLWSCNDGEQAAERAECEGGVFTCSLVSTLETMLGAGRTLTVDESLVAEVVAAMSALDGGAAQHPQYSASGQGVVLHAGPSLTAVQPAPPVPPPPPEALWHTSERGTVSAGMPLASLQSRIASGAISRRALVWSPEVGVWTPAGDLPAFSPLFPQIEIPVPPPPPPVPPEPAADDVKTVLLPGGVPWELVWCPPGEFLMGSPEGELGRSSDEGPQHKVTFSRGFWLGKYPVTQSQWESVTGENPSRFEDAGRPVERVSWNGCQDFLNKLNSATGTGEFRLPSGAEWEYACRAGTTSALYTGEELTTAAGRCPRLDRLAWYGENSGRKTHPVGKLIPNAWGLHDMLGNVWEWCEDRLHGNYRNAPADGSAWTDGDNSYRVFRGGSWSSSAGNCRAAYRFRIGPGFRYSNLGLRLALSPAVH